MKDEPWYGVDLDGTIAFYDGWVDEYHIGEPIPLMVKRVKEIMEDGFRVRIFTARVDGVFTPKLVETLLHPKGMSPEQARQALRSYIETMGFSSNYKNHCLIAQAIQEWCEQHIGVRLTVTNRKDFSMIACFDDRAIQIEKNTGELIGDGYRRMKRGEAHDKA